MNTPIFYSNINYDDSNYLNKKVHIIIDDDVDHVDAIGIVTSIDDIGQLHGTWGGLAVMPGIDYIEVIE